ncbi:MAG: nucleotidyl transferase AbiEii/AbiGii toxin family protein [Ilumatobacteraceae bacterium]
MGEHGCLANDDYLGEELVFRGGTCLHKLHLDPALRYSEDLDYVRRSAGSISEIIDAIRTIANGLGMSVSTKITTNPKIRLRAPFESGSGTMSVKIEVNTYERSPARELQQVSYSVDNQWYRGGADVQTFTVAELVATKIRALYQRSKGRDLFDLWLALTNLDQLVISWPGDYDIDTAAELVIDQLFSRII